MNGSPSDLKVNSHSAEVKRGERFEFGDNWTKFLELLDDQRIACAEQSLRSMLETESLAGMSFLDIGSGSGLFSLAARRLGARVISFDYDPQSVACTRELRRRYSPHSESWSIEEGSVLDDRYMRSLGTFDVVYSWGVLHHTGDMWRGLTNAAAAVAPGGLLFLAIYNDRGTQSVRWRRIKKTYCRLPPLLRAPFAFLVTLHWEVKPLLRAILTLPSGDYFRGNSQSVQARGMNRWRDIVDWVGGYPYEVAKPEQILQFCRARGFNLIRLKSSTGIGCNEFVFVKNR